MKSLPEGSNSAWSLTADTRQVTLAGAELAPRESVSTKLAGRSTQVSTVFINQNRAGAITSAEADRDRGQVTPGVVSE